MARSPRCCPAAPGAALPKQVALLASGLTLVVALAIAVQYDAGAGMQFTETHVWIEAFGAYYALGVDGIALTLVLLTALLVPVVVLASWHDADTRNTSAFFGWMLALEGLALAVFLAQDVFLFYVVFEATLIPVYFLIGGFGNAEPRPRRGEVPALHAVRRSGHARLGGRALRPVRRRRAARRT